MDVDNYLWVRTALAIAIHVVILCVAAWDLAAIATGHPTLSVSHLTQGWAKENPILPLLVGVVIGHLFWPIG